MWKHFDPNLNEMTRTAKVRVILPNADRALFHKQTATGRVLLELPDVLLAPRTAVLQHGGEPVVFLQQTGRAYLARRVSLGRVGDDNVEILSGLKPKDKVIVGPFRALDELKDGFSVLPVKVLTEEAGKS